MHNNTGKDNLSFLLHDIAMRAARADCKCSSFSTCWKHTVKRHLREYYISIYKPEGDITPQQIEWYLELPCEDIQNPKTIRCYCGEACTSDDYSQWIRKHYSHKEFYEISLK